MEQPRAPLPEQAPLPEGWVHLRSKAGEAFFHHFESGVTQAERPTASSSVQISTTVASAEGVPGCTASYPSTVSAADTAPSSRRGGADGNDTQADQHRTLRQWGWGKKHETPTFTRRCSTGMTDLPSPEAPQELSSPMRRRRPTEHPPLRPISTSRRTGAIERTTSDIWRDASPAATPQGTTNPTQGTHSRNGGGRYGGGGGSADLDCGDEAGEDGRRDSVRDRVATCKGGIPPGSAGKSASTFRATTKSLATTRDNVYRGPNGSVATSDDTGTKTSFMTSPPLPFSLGIGQSPPTKSPPKLGDCAMAASRVPPSSLPSYPPGQATELTGSSAYRLDLLRVRTNGAGVGQDHSGGWRGGAHATTGDGRSQQRGRGDGFEKDDEVANGNASPTTERASNGVGLTLEPNDNRGGLLSKTGSLRLMEGARGRKQQPDTAGKNALGKATAAPQHERNDGESGRNAWIRPTAAVRRGDQPASDDSDGSGSKWYRFEIGGSGRGGGEDRENGVRGDGGARDAGGRRPQTSKAPPSSTSTSNVSAVSHAVGVGGVGVGRVVADVVPDTHGTPQPGPSPASASGQSSPPSVERPRRNFFRSPGQARTRVVDGDGGDGGEAGGGGERSESSIAERSKTSSRKQEGAHGSLAGRSTNITAPATSASSSSSSGNNISRPKTSVAAAAAAAAAGKGRGATSRPRTRRRPSSASPPFTPPGTGVTDTAATGCTGDAVEGGTGPVGVGEGDGCSGNTLSKMLGATMSRRATSGGTGANPTACTAAAASITAALNQKPSSLPGSSVDNSRPHTSRSRSLPPGAGRRGSGKSRPSTSVPALVSGSRRAAGRGREANEGGVEGGGGGLAVGDSDGAVGYRAFVEARFHKGNGAAQLLTRFSAKSITELMCHTTASPRHALLSSTPRHLAEASIGMFRKIQSFMGDTTPNDSPEGPGDEDTLRGVLLCGRSNLHLACELYCQLVKQTHRCVNAEKEERGFVLLACTASLLPPPTDNIAAIVLGHLALHRTRNCPVGGLSLYTHHHVSNGRQAWAPVLESDPLIPMSERMRDYARNCFVPGTVFGGRLADTLRQEYYAVGVGAVTSPAPPETSESARVPVLVQLLVQTVELLGGVRTEGIFRRPGHEGAKAALMKAISAADYSVLRRLRDEGKLDKGQLPGDENFEVDVYTVADTLKAWLRRLEEPLVPSESYERAVAAGRLSAGKGARQEQSMRVLLALPSPNSVTLDFLVRFFGKVANQEKNNRMNTKSLAVVLSPNLLRNPEGDPQIFKANANAETIFVKSLIEGSRQ